MDEKQNDETVPKIGDLRVWWIPQVPMKEIFYVKVASIEEAKKVYSVIAQYDLFQFENKIKPDYASAGGLEVLPNGGEWIEWQDADGNTLEDLINKED